MPDDATLAKLLSDALTHVESLKTQLAAADARAAHFERLALHNETRLRDAADVLSTLERTMLHARTELARVLPSSSSSTEPLPSFKPTPAPTPRAAVVLPTAKTLSFPSLPPPPMHNPQRSVPAVATLAPATAPRSSPQPTTIVATAPAAAPSPATSTGQKRKRADSTDLDDELAAAVDGVSDSASEMSLDDMILAVSGPSPATEHPPTTATATTTTAPAAAVPPPRKKPSPPATTTGPAVVHASHNALGQRQCRACGQAGRYKDGKCVEKWGPGPAGPGTVCDRCRKKMKRVERRSDLAQQQQQQQQSSAAASPAPAPATAAAQSTAPTTPAPSTAAPSPHMRPSTASSSTLSTLSPLAEPERERERVVLPPAKSLGLVGLGLLSSPPLSDAPVPAPIARPFYDAAREVTTTSSSTSSSSGASHFGSSRRTSPAPSFAALAGLGGGRFAYEPPTSSVRSYPVSSHRHWRDEVEPVS